MIGIDTNVLVRLLAVDDAAQSARAHAAIARAEAAGEQILINDIVLVETLWTMARRYKRPRGELIELARGILEAGSFAFEARSQLEEAVHLFESSAADFSDCLIVVKNKQLGSRTTLTFDADCLKLPSASAV